jgi:hypothetical protein
MPGLLFGPRCDISVGDFRQPVLNLAKADEWFDQYLKASR